MSHLRLERGWGVVPSRLWFWLFTAVASADAAASQLTNFLGSPDRSIATPLVSGVEAGGFTPDGHYAAISGQGAARLDLSAGLSDPIGTNPVTLERITADRCAISSDGRLAVFQTWMNHLDPGDQNDLPDIYLKDFNTGAITILSRSAIGWIGGGESPSISGDGSTVAFLGYGDGLVPFDLNNRQDFYVCDVATGSLEMLNVDVAGLPPSYSGCAPVCAFGELQPYRTALSDDGRFVVFASVADGLTTHTGPTWYGNVYVRDRAVGVTELVSQSVQGQRANARSGVPHMSADGRFVVFESEATDLLANLPPPPPYRSQVYIRDRTTQITSLLSATPAGQPSEVGCFWPVISGDGRRVMFLSNSATLDPSSPNTDFKVFLVEVGVASPRVVSGSTVGTPPLLGASPSPGDLDHTGERIIFHSRALTPGTGGWPNEMPYLRDERVQSVPITAYCTAKTNTLGCAPSMSTAGICSFTYPTAFFVTSARQRSHQIGQLIWSTTQQTTPFQGGFLCVGWPLKRTPVQASLGASSANDCTGGYSFLFSSQYASANGLGPGSTVYAQYWSRDPSASNPGNRNLSNAIAFTWAP